MRAREFIFESYKDARKEFSRVADPALVQTTIDQYKQLVNKNQFRNPAEKNINYWRERGWEAFSQMVKVKSGDVTDTQLKKGKVVGNAIFLRDDAEWTVLIPLDKETSVHYGKGTEWCTTKPYQSYFEEYMYQDTMTLIYAINKTKGNRSVAISIEPPSKNNEYDPDTPSVIDARPDTETNSEDIIEMFDYRDVTIDAAKYTEISGLEPTEFIKLAKLPENQQQLELAREEYREAREATQTLLKASPLDPEAIERGLKFTKNSEDCYDYIVAYSNEQKDRVKIHPSILVAASNYESDKPRDGVGQYIDFTDIPNGVIKSIFRTKPTFIINNFNSLTRKQQLIYTSSSEAAYEFALKLHAPFPAGEPAIATNSHFAELYALNILTMQRSPTWEQLIKDNAQLASTYAFKVNKRFPAGEAAIATVPALAYAYAERFFKGKGWPEAEHLFANDEYVALDYIRYVLLGKRFPAAEPMFSKNAEYAVMYAVYTNAPFPAGEPAIATNENSSSKYTSEVLYKHRSESWEKLIKDDPKNSFEYAQERWKPFFAGEAAIATNPKYAAEYDDMFGTNIANKSYLLSDREELIKDDPERSLSYAKELNRPFPLGEPAILKDQECSREYVQAVLRNHRSPSWEKLIKDDPDASYEYAKVLNDRFPAGEAAIATKYLLAMFYDSTFGTKLAQR